MRTNPLAVVADTIRYIATWRTTGAVAPSGRALARRMASYLDPAAPGLILELGPGNGVVTRAIIDRGVAPERIVAVEYNAEFCDMLSERHPGLRVIRGDAYDLAETLRDINPGPFSAAVSSLPLLMRPAADRDALVDDVLHRLAPGGSMIQFSYSPKPPVNAAPGKYRVEGSPYVIMNLPPARVWTYRRAA